MRRDPLPVLLAFSLVATLTVPAPAMATGAAAHPDTAGFPLDIDSRPPLGALDTAADDWSDHADALIVRPAGGRSFGEVRARIAGLNGGGAELGDDVGDGGARIVTLQEDVAVEELRDLGDRLEAEGLVEHAEPDVRMLPFVVDDPYYAYQWNLSGSGGTNTTHGIDVETAWTSTTGSPAVTVAVLDTGERSHPDIDDRVVPGYDMISDAAAARDGDGRDDDPTDEGDWTDAGDCDIRSAATPSSWHGLHVAGTIGASTNNGIGVAGVDQGARLQHVRVLGRCGGPSSDIADAIRWAAGQSLGGVPDNATPARVINLSFGGSGECGPTLQSAVDAAAAAGSVVIAAAGNANEDAADTTPANCDGVITVAATSPAGDRAGVSLGGLRTPYSNYGEVVDIAAPGGDNSFPGGGILSTHDVGETTAEGPSYASLLGTSMAAPHVAGVVSLMSAVNPGLTPTLAREILTGTARSFGGSSGAFVCSSSSTATHRCGAGIVDAGAAVAIAAADGEVSAPELSASNADLAVSLSWTTPASLDEPMDYELRRSTGAACTATSPIIVGPTAARTYTDAPLAHGTTYRYCVTAVDGNGQRSPASNTRSVTATDLTAPAAPSLSATGGNEQVSLSWSAVSDPTTPVTYRLYRSTSSSCTAASTLVRTQKARTYTDIGLEAGTTYLHCVTATDGAGQRSTVSNATSSRTNPALPASSPGAVCHALVGDWNGSGRSGLGWWCDGRTRLRTAQDSTHDFYYGRRGDVPIVADWNGDGKDTVSIIRDGTWHVNNTLEGGASERTFVYGRVARGDVPIAGSWDGLARSLPGIIRDREWHLRDDQSGGRSTSRFVYGRLTAGDLPLVGDWDADKRDSAGIVRGGTWHLRNSHTGGTSDISYIYGRVNEGDTPVVGDWTGDGMDTPGIVRDGAWLLKDQHSGGPADRTIAFKHP